MRTSTEIDKIAADLVKAHQKITHATKDSNNPHFKSGYASLESVIDSTKEALLENNIVMIQGMNPDGMSLTTRLQHSSGQFIEADTKIILTKNDMQGLGSAITYARRQGGAAMNNIAQQDDDADGAKPGKKAKPTKEEKPASKSNSAPAAFTDDF